MGFSLAWIAVSGKPKAEVLSFFSLSEGAQNVAMLEAEITGVQLPNDWYLIVLNDIVSPLTVEEGLLKLSDASHVCLCQIDEHFMTSSLVSYSNGQMQFSVCHFAEIGIYHLEVEGNAPARLDIIHGELQKSQDREGGEDAGCDYLFEVPIELAFHICGFKHDLGITSELAFSKLLTIKLEPLGIC